MPQRAKRGRAVLKMIDNRIDGSVQIILYTITSSSEYSSAIFPGEVYRSAKRFRQTCNFDEGNSNEIARKEMPTLVGVLAGLGLHRRCLLSPRELTSANSAVTDGRSTAFVRTAIAGPWRSFLPVSGLNYRF